MNNTPTIIREIREKIKKLEAYSKGGLPPHQGFTIDLYYAGNTRVDVPRISIGSISDDIEVGQIFFNIMLGSLKNSLTFWEDVARKEIEELQNSLNSK